MALATALLALVASMAAVTDALGAWPAYTQNDGNAVTATTVVAPTGLNAMSGASLCGVTLRRNVNLNWTASVTAAATGYTILRGTTNGGPYSPVGTVNGRNTTTFTDVAPTGPVNGGATALYVANYVNNTVTPIDVATNTTKPTIAVGPGPGGSFPPGNGMTFSADGKTMYEVNWNNAAAGGSVTPVDVATNTAKPNIVVGRGPSGVAITPNGATMYVANYTDNQVAVVNLATGLVTTRINVGAGPEAVAVTPDGTTVISTNASAKSVSFISTTTNAVLGTITDAWTAPDDIAITSDSLTAYITDKSTTITPITIATRAVRPKLTVGRYSQAIAVTPDGCTAYVTNHDDNSVSPVNLTSGVVGTPIAVGTGPDAITITPDGLRAYVANYGSNNVTPITLLTGTAMANIAVGTGPDAIAATPAAPPSATFYYYVCQTNVGAWLSGNSNQAAALA